MEEKVVFVRVKEAASQNLLNTQVCAPSIYFAGMKLHPHFARVTEGAGKGVALGMHTETKVLSKTWGRVHDCWDFVATTSMLQTFSKGVVAGPSNL